MHIAMQVTRRDVIILAILRLEIASMKPQKLVPV